MQKTNGHRDTDIFINNRRFDCRDTRVTRQMSLRNRRCVIDDHSAVVQEPFDNIDGVLRRAEVFVELFHTAVRIGQGDIVPRVDVDFVQIGCAEERSQDRIFYHFGVQAVNELFFREAVDKVSTIEDEFLDIGLQLITLMRIGQHGSIVLGDILLCFREKVIKLNPYHKPPPCRQSPASAPQTVCPLSSHEACLAEAVL